MASFCALFGQQQAAASGRQERWRGQMRAAPKEPAHAFARAFPSPPHWM